MNAETRMPNPETTPRPETRADRQPSNRSPAVVSYQGPAASDFGLRTSDF